MRVRSLPSDSESVIQLVDGGGDQGGFGDDDDHASDGGQQCG